LQFIWHYVDTVVKGVTFRPTRYVVVLLAVYITVSGALSVVEDECWC